MYVVDRERRMPGSGSASAKKNMRPFSVRSLSFLILLAGMVSCRSGDEDPARYVDPFIGTGADGHTFPGPVWPFGMIQPGPDTRVTGPDDATGYHYSDSSIIGFSHLRYSGTGRGAGGDVLLMPLTGKVQWEPGPAGQPDKGYRSRFSHDDEEASPGYYRVKLKDVHVTAELTALRRVAFHRYTWHRQDTALLLLDLVHGIHDRPDSLVLHITGPRTVEGCRRSVGGLRNYQTVWFAIEFSEPFKSHTLLCDSLLSDTASRTAGHAVKALFRFPHTRTLEVKVALSRVDPAGARRNLQEGSEKDFDEARRAARKAWNKELQKITVRTRAPRYDTLFYTALYHCFLLPSLDNDRDGRYRSPNHRIYRSDDHEVYTNFSLWDTFRGLHPLFTLVQRSLTRNLLATFLDRYRHTGNLPVFELSGNDLPIMIGFHSLPVIADAWVKGMSVRDTLEMLQAMKELARLPYGTRTTGNVFGYLPYDYTYQAVSRTLEFAYDDWCVAVVARDPDTAAWQYYNARSHFYRNLYDTVTGFMRPRDHRGHWLEPFDPLAYTRNYTQANAWQYTTFVPHDLQGLIDMMGGDQAFGQWLDRFFTTENPTTYQGRRSSLMIGQYYHGNEPSHHVAYLYDHAGMPWKTQAMVRKIMESQYRCGPEGLAGNDDAGQMSAWYVLSALGFYSVTPGTDRYALGSPLVEKAVIRLENGKKFRIVVRDNTPEHVYIRSVSLNGRPLDRSYLRHAEIMAGGTLEFVMGAVPDTTWARGCAQRPLPPDWPVTPMVKIAPEGHSIPPDGIVTFEGMCRTTLSAAGAGKILYSCDGRDPCLAGRPYVSPLSVDSGCLLQACSVAEDAGAGYPAWLRLRRLTPLPAVTVRRPRPGLTYHYRRVWACRHLNQMRHYPVVREGVAATVGTSLDFPLDDKHAITFQGYLKVPQTGIYTFYLISEDGSRLEIDGRPVILNEGRWREARLALQKGMHRIRVDHAQVGGTPKLRLEWSGPSFTAGPVPSGAFFH